MGKMKEFKMISEKELENVVKDVLGIKGTICLEYELNKLPIGTVIVKHIIEHPLYKSIDEKFKLVRKNKEHYEEAWKLTAHPFEKSVVGNIMCVSNIVDNEYYTDWCFEEAFESQEQAEEWEKNNVKFSIRIPQ